MHMKIKNIFNSKSKNFNFYGNRDLNNQEYIIYNVNLLVLKFSKYNNYFITAGEK